MTNVIECTFKAPPPTATTPSNALIWNQFQYSDGAGWYSIPNHEELILRQTVFEDKRIKFLPQLQKVPEQYESILCGKYDAKAWGKDDCTVIIEGDKDVHIILPQLKEKLSYNHPKRFPTFLKNWKIILTLTNRNIAMVRINAETALLISIDSSKNATVKAIDFNSGFLCVNPETNLAIAYGGFALNELRNCEKVPPMVNESGSWGFFVHLFKWGHIIVPKELELKLPAPGLKLIGKKNDTIALVSIPPNVLIHVRVDGPKCVRRLIYEKDFNITAVKTSETDVDIYLLFDGQLLKYEFSFDIRLNKPEKSRSNQNAKLKCVGKTKEATSFVFQKAQNFSVLLASNCPTDNLGHLLSNGTICIFNAETGEYLSHPQGLLLTKMFTKLSYPAEKN